MRVNIEVQCTAKPLNQCYRAGAGCLSRIACFPDLMHGDKTVNDARHLGRDQRAAGEKKEQLEWETEHRLMWPVNRSLQSKKYNR